MAAVLVTYDLNSPGQKYEELYKKLKAYNGWAKLMESTWIVLGDSASAVSDDLRTVLDDGDHIFCVEIDDQPRQGWLNKKKWEWMRTHV